MRQVMWEWTVRNHPIARQIEATAAAGFDVLTLPYRKYLEEEAAGNDIGDLARIARDQGIALDFLDGMSGWAPIRYPEGADELLRTSMDFGPDEAFALCEQAGLSHIVAIAGFFPGMLSHAQLVDSFGAFCEQAAARDIWVDLEPMPMLGLPTLRSAWEIVRDAGAANSGLLLDFWHFMRGDPDFGQFGEIPRGRIVNIQIVDALATPRVDNLWEEVLHYRELPGQGEFPLVELMTVLCETQELRSAGPEAMSDALDEIPLIEGAKLAGRLTRDLLDKAGYAI